MWVLRVLDFDKQITVNQLDYKVHCLHKDVGVDFLEMDLAAGIEGPKAGRVGQHFFDGDINAFNR